MGCLSASTVENEVNAGPGMVWYFAIGSMINNVGLNARGIVPKKSIPAEILDFELIFFSSNGVACALQKPGKSFHGVLHLCTDEEMKTLDKIELSYKRIPS